MRNARPQSFTARLAGALGFGYDAVVSSPNRKQRRSVLLGEDAVLKGKERRKALSNTRELRRNFAVAAWALRTHCAHVAQHSFQSRSGDTDLDDRIEALVADWSRPNHCDATGRHSLDRMIWLAEMARITDGECFLHDLGDGRWQVIEADRVAKPRDGGPRLDDDAHVEGVVIDKLGRAMSYLVCRRTRNDGREFAAQLSAEAVLHHGCFDRPDQVRGVSPLLAALNGFQDIAESAEYALAKAKMATYFGVNIKRGEDWTPPEDEATKKIDLGKGPQVFEHSPEEEIGFMHVDQPGTAFREYLHSMLMMALKALDLDFCFYDSSHTNYSGARQTMLMYQRSSAIRKREVRDLLDEMTRRRLRLAVKRSEIELPAGQTIDGLRWQWIPSGMGWIDPLKEVRAHAAAVAAGIKSRQQIATESGLNFFDVADQLGEEAAYLAEKGLDTANAAQLAAIAAPGSEESEQEEDSR